MEERKERALRQRLYLLEAEYKNAKWKFVVRGSTGNRYTVSILSNSVSCNCFDCKRRKATCKHIYFIVGRVAQDHELLKDMGSQLTFPILDKITPKLLRRLGSSIPTNESSCQNTLPEIDRSNVPRDTTCSICYEDLESSESFGDVDTCTVCKNGYHKDCIAIWLRNKDTCPMCRNIWGTFELSLEKLTIN